MTMMEALVALHGSNERQGPGDDEVTRRLLRRLPGLPAEPRVADLGCGTGASALVLADALGVPVVCVDAVPEFIAALLERAKARRLDHLIHPVVGDMTQFRHPDGPLDLLWSEGAAYNLTFAGALRAWWPLLREGGFSVISELSWFTAAPAAEPRAFWAEAYPALAGEAENSALAEASGFEVLFTERLPQRAWRENYYAPLSARADALEDGAPAALRAVIEETRDEIALFERFGGDYGYTFYGLKAV